MNHLVELALRAMAKQMIRSLIPDEQDKLLDDLQCQLVTSENAIKN